MPAPLVPPLSPRGAVVVTPETASAVHWLGGRMSIFDAGELSRYAFSAAVDSLPGGGGPIWHRHTREEEVFHVLEGAVDFFSANLPGGVRVEAGGLIVLPPGLPHRFQNARADEGSPLLMFTVPGGNMQFFADLSAPISEPEDPTDPPDVAAFAAAARRYGITMLGPDERVGATIHQEILPLAAGRLPTHVPAGAGEAWCVEGCNVVLKATGGATAGRCTVAEITLPPSGALPRLRHARFAVGVYAFDGNVVLTTDAGDTPLPAGGLATVPFGVTYQLRNLGGGPASVLTLSAPAGLEEFWRAAGTPSPLTTRGLYPESVPANPARVAAAGRDWGVEVDPE